MLIQVHFISPLHYASKEEEEGHEEEGHEEEENVILSQKSAPTGAFFFCLKPKRNHRSF